MKSLSNMGKLTLLIGLLLLVPLSMLPFFPQDACYACAFLVPAGASLLMGGLLCLIKRRESISRQTATHSGNLLVLYIWLYSFVMGAIPFVLSGQLTFVQALFESVSGWTTTGLSVVDVESTPTVFLFYRSFMQFCGGLGFVLIMTTVIHEKMAMVLYSAEGHPDKLRPTLRETVRVIVYLYLFFFVVGTAAYALCGMPLFDSILHAMGALSTGGFSNRTDSIGAYHSPAIEAVSVVLMLIGTTNFAILLLFFQRKFRTALRCSELRLMGLLLVILAPLTALSLMSGLYMRAGEGFRQAVFNIVSAISTTGYATMPYANWPAAAIGMMILAMLIGGGVGSTAGGIKLTRSLILLKSAWRQMLRRVLPEHNVSELTYHRAQGKAKIDSDLATATGGFVVVYLAIFIMGTLLLTVTAGATLTEAMFEFASCLSTVGLSIGITGPSTANATLLVEIVGMILGRLEIYLVLTGVYSAVFLLRHTFFSQKHRG